MRYFSLSFLLTFLVLFTGCDNPGTVGLETLDDLANAPNRKSVALTPSLLAKGYKDVTGGSSPMLVGQAQEVEALSGVSYEAIGYMDFLENDTRTTNFKNGPISDVSLVLTPNYRYGDTSGELQLALYDMDKEWVGTGAKYDSLLVNGAQVTVSAAFSPTASLVTIPLPSTWYAGKSDIIRDQSGDFATDLHGFQLRAVNAKAILGFDAAKSYLRVVSGGDTLKFSTTTSKLHSYIKRMGSPSLQDGRILLQDNTGDGLKLDFDISALQHSSNTGLIPDAISSATIRIKADTLNTQTVGNFQRPSAKLLGLWGVKSDGTQDKLASAVLKDGVYLFNSRLIINEVQRKLIGKALYTRLVVAPDFLTTSGVSNSLDPYLLYGSTASEALKPTFIVTYVPIN